LSAPDFFSGTVPLDERLVHHMAYVLSGIWVHGVYFRHRPKAERRARVNNTRLDLLWARQGHWY